MKKNLFLFVFCTQCLLLSAQAQSISLQEAIEMGWKNRLELQEQALEIDIARRADTKINAQWLPQVDVNADFRYNILLQQSVLPVGEFGIPGIPSDETQTIAFGVPFQNQLGLDVKQKLFDANKSVDRKINATQTAIQETRLETEQLNIRTAVTEAYYTCLFQQEKIRIAEQNLALFQANLDNGKVKFDNGALLKNDLNRLQLDVSNANLTLTKARKDYELAQEQLRYSMNAPEETQWTPSENLVDLLARVPANLPTVEINRPELREQQLNSELNVLQADKQTARRKPSVSARGNLSALALNTDLTAFSYVGIQAAIPIYDGKLARHDAEDYQIRSQKSRLEGQRLQYAYTYEASSARKRFEKARLDMDISTQNITLARDIYATDQGRYQLGALSDTDLKASQYALQAAENNYLNTIYELLVSALQYQIAVGNSE
ncbi:MAG: TolC family protein [Saprospiraceae bacterium]|nr:TolC family protein [Saprospiraceae bacterium]